MHVMLLPTLACPAECAYCFGPHKGGPEMDIDTLESFTAWLKTLGGRDTLEITFHGGEPLLPGAGFYRRSLPHLREVLFPRKVNFSVQSNLWLLDDELCRLFREFGVSLGTSLDGPEDINDAQRGKDCFRRTMAGIDRARRHGLAVGCICTFTSRSARYAEEIFTFFAREELDFSIHAAAPALGRRDETGLTLLPQAFGPLLVDMLDLYLDNLERVRIPFLDALCRSVSAGRSGICTFSDCLGTHNAVGPDGLFYPCQRFAGFPRYALGRVRDLPSPEALSASDAWRHLEKRRHKIQDECGDCPHFEYCKGGCPYNAAAVSGGNAGESLRDPYCPAYRRIFDAVIERGVAAVFSEDNLRDVVKRGGGEHGLLHKGGLLRLMRGDPHPRETAHEARKIAAAVALASSPSTEEAAGKLLRAGIATRHEHAIGGLTAFKEQLLTESRRLVNNYIHVTYACSLACGHCYTEAGPHRAAESMGVENVLRLVRESAEAGFDKAVITGGEPLDHPRRDALLDVLSSMRREVKPMETVLRTNLAGPITPPLMGKLAHAFDRIIISLDGDEACHDARRGTGSYALTTSNLRRLIEEGPSASVSIAAVLPGEKARGREGDAVRGLAEDLGIGVRFKPILPIGRAENMSLTPEYYTTIEGEGEFCRNPSRFARPVATCGLGMNLSVAPDGECFPCHALTNEGAGLGNAISEGLRPVLSSAKFLSLKRINVDSNRRCRLCALRYVCGGFCRAWAENNNPDSPPLDCTQLHNRARDLLLRALEYLDVTPQRWLEAGLPLPDNPPGERGAHCESHGDERRTSHAAG